MMWVGAHPDDETLAGPILARACIGLSRPCLFLVMNHGDHGECLLREGCWPSLAEVRGREMVRVAQAYGAELHHYWFWNAPLPVESFPPREEIAKRWRATGDPAELVARAIRRFKPTILISFDPDRGFTGHPEHQLASRFALEGAARARPVHEVPNVYQVLNHFWLTRLAGTSDPNEPTELFETHVSCGKPGKTCLDTALEITRFHETQRRDMGLVRALRPQMGRLFVRRLSPSS